MLTVNKKKFMIFNLKKKWNENGISDRKNKCELNIKLTFIYK